MKKIANVKKNIIAEMKSKEYLVHTIISILTRYSLRLSFVGLVALGYVFLQAFMFHVIMSFLTGSSNSYKVPYFDVKIYFENDIFMLVFLGLIGIVSVFLVYLSKIVSVSIMVDYERFCVSALSQKLLCASSKNVKISKKEYIVLCSKDCRFGGRLAFEISNSVMPVGVCAILIPALFFLNGMLTSLLLSVVGLAIISQLLLRPMIRQTAQLMETNATADSTAKSAEYDRIVDAINVQDSKIIHDFSSRIPDKDFMNTYKNRLILPHLGNLVGGISYAIILVVIVGFYSLQHNQLNGHEDFIFYCLIAFFCFSQMKILSKIYMNMSVFNEYFSRARHFINFGETKSDSFKKPSLASQAGDVDHDFLQ